MLLLTNYQKFSALNQHKFIILRVCLLESWCISHWAKIKVSAGLHSFLETPAENVFLLLFLVSVDCPYSLTHGSRFHFQSQQGRVEWALLIQYYSVFAFVITSSLTLILLLPLSTFKDLCDCTGPTWIICNTPPSETQLMNNLSSICNLNSSLPWNSIYSDSGD